ncbi:MAG: ATP-binding protein [Candidatus Parabeggiatoa sp. nov. 2]|nr:MAG: ATP-binding protein [Gammaproteobacteria bacterium]
MKINSFKIDIKEKNWHIEEMVFDNFNLLVGVSGVGKTRIVKTILGVCQVATGNYQPQEVVDWKIGFVHAEQEYEWELRSSLVEHDFYSVSESEFVFERILKKVGDEKIVLLERSEKVNQLDGKELPKLKKTESAINLLSKEPSIAPIYEGFNRFIFSQAVQQVVFSVNLETDNAKQRMPLDDFKKKSTQLPSVVKAYRLAKFYPEAFNQIKKDFTDIFPSVEDIKVSVIKKTEGYEFSFNIKENSQWVSQSQISSGMFRTLVHLIDISLAPQGSVIVIDEFENSLGINCMPDLTDFVMSKAPHLQFILTSHHPYIISKIPSKTWKLVRRKGATVSVINATNIPQLQTGSRLNKFLQLANLPEYKKGIL